MNKDMLTLFTVLCLLSVLFLMGCKISVKAVPRTWIIVDDDGEADFNVIQDAINNATSGDTIFVRKGIYYEHNIIVNKSVSLVGEDRGSTIVDGNGIGNVIKILMTNNVIIEELAIQRSGMNPGDYGILVDHSSDCNISRNIITNNGNGIGFQSSGNNVVSGNIITNRYSGIVLYVSTSNVFSGNTISYNNNGISLAASAFNVVSGNIITNNYDGIFLYISSVFNVFSGNTISYNNLGMHFTLDSGNNIIYLNNFNNTHQVESDSTNVWDNGNEGNYWSDYLGHDLNADGIGEDPHVIDENNQDNHPLMGMFSAFNIALERETYQVTTICNSTISEFKFEIGPETGNKIICFKVIGKDDEAGFCRVTIPTELMNYPFIIIVDGEEISPTFLDAAKETLYFTYILSNRTITIISSKAQHLYYELLDKHEKLQTFLYYLNATYYDLLNNYDLLLGNYSQLQESYRELNNSYQEHLLDYSKDTQNIRNLTYIFAATTAIFIMTTVYLSKNAHAGKTSAHK